MTSAFALLAACGASVPPPPAPGTPEYRVQRLLAEADSATRIERWDSDRKNTPPLNPDVARQGHAVLDQAEEILGRPEPRTMLLRIHLMTAQHRFDEAWAMIGEIAADPRADEELIKQAGSMYGTIIQMDPKYVLRPHNYNSGTFIMAAETALERGDPHLALKIMERLGKPVHNNFEHTDLTLAQILTALGRYEEAWDALDRVRASGRYAKLHEDRADEAERRLSAAGYPEHPRIARERAASARVAATRAAAAAQPAPRANAQRSTAQPTGAEVVPGVYVTDRKPYQNTMRWRTLEIRPGGRALMKWHQAGSAFTSDRCQEFVDTFDMRYTRERDGSYRLHYLDGQEIECGRVVRASREIDHWIPAVLNVTDEGLLVGSADGGFLYRPQ